MEKGIEERRGLTYPKAELSEPDQFKGLSYKEWRGVGKGKRKRYSNNTKNSKCQDRKKQ